MEFKVTSSDLESLAHGLSGLLGDLSHAGDVRSVSGSAAENGQLEAAIDEFVMAWMHDLQAIQENLASLSEHLSSAGHAYETVERNLQDGLAV